MSLTATVTRSVTFTLGMVPSIDQWHLLGTPQVSITGSVGAGDIEDGAVSFSDLAPDLLLSGLNLITQLEGTDTILIGDDSEDANSVITVSSFLASVGTLPTVATAFDDYTADTVVWHRADVVESRKSTIAYFAESLINQAPLIGEATSAADGILITNASAAAGAKAQLVDLDSLLPQVITAGTYTNPTSLSVRADGRLTSITASSGGTNAVAWLRDTGASGTVAQAVSAATETVVRLTTTSTVTWLALAANIFTVEAGTYEIDAVMPFVSSNADPIVFLLYNNTTSAVLATSGTQTGSDDDVHSVPLKAVVTVATSTALTLRAYSPDTFSVGAAAAQGYDETFTQVLLRRLN